MNNHVDRLPHTRVTQAYSGVSEARAVLLVRDHPAADLHWFGGIRDSAESAGRHSAELSIRRTGAGLEHRRRLRGSDLVRPFGLLRRRGVYVDHPADAIQSVAMDRNLDRRSDRRAARISPRDDLRASAWAILHFVDIGFRRSRSDYRFELGIAHRRPGRTVDPSPPPAWSEWCSHPSRPMPR